MKITNYRPEIDGLRCIAVCAVIFYHFGIGLFSGGYVGVDIFFVISGYLITRIINDSIISGKFSFIDFYERRARRILPALFAMLFFSVIAAYIFLSPNQLKDFSLSLLSVSAFVSNHYFLSKTGYFSPNAEEIPLLHTWTLSVEEQFYIVVPILMLAFWKIRPKAMNWGLMFILFLSFAICIRWEHRGSLTVGFYLAAARAWEFIVGAMLAISVEKTWPREAITNKLANVFSTLGLILVITSATVFTSQTSYPGIYTTIPVIGAALIIYFAVPTTCVGRLLSSRLFVAIGLISYSAYLWHQPLLAFFQIAFGGTPGNLAIVILLIITALLSFLSWYFVETQFRDRTKSSKKLITIVSLIGTVAFVTVGLAGWMNEGFSGRYSAAQNALELSSAPSPMRGKCQVEGVLYMKPEDACRYFGKKTTWAVFGDSHAVEISYALAEYLRNINAGGVLQLGASGCQPALKFETKVLGCRLWNERSLDYISRDHDITDVVLSYRHSLYLFGLQSKTYPILPNEHPNFLYDQSSEEARETYWKNFVAIIDRLIADGKIVHVVEPVPELGRPVGWNIYSPTIGAVSVDRSKGVDFSYYNARNKFIIDKIRTLKTGPHLKIVNTSDAFCDKEKCLALLDGKSMYFDDNHMSVIGAMRVVKLLMER